MTKPSLDDVDLLTGLLQAYSPTGQEGGAVGYLVDQMRWLGYTAEVDQAGSAVGCRGDGPQEIVLLGHVDTVPGMIPVHAGGDRLYGRGSVDAKGSLACFTVAAARVPVPPGWRLTVVGAVGEEGDSRGARYRLDKHIPRFTIIGEPSGWEHVTLGYKGSQWFTYQVNRPLAHTASRAGSACEYAVAFWNHLTAKCIEINTDHPKVFEQVTPSLRAFDSGTDGFTDSARLEINLRLPVWMNVETARTLIKGLASDGEVDFKPGDEAYRGEKNSPLLRAFLQQIREAGGEPRFIYKSGTSDMNTVGPAWRCPILAYGPGDSDLDHTPGEHILIPEYLRSIDILAGVLQTLMQDCDGPTA